MPEEKVQIQTSKPIKIETDRLIIRDHIASDFLGLSSLLTAEKEMYFLMDLYASDSEAVKSNLETAIAAIDSPVRDKYFFAIIERASGAYIGEIGFTILERRHEDSNVSSLVELGYFIKSDYWGNGIVTEAGEAVIEFAFLSIGIHKITTGCAKENRASERVMVKLGFVKEAELYAHQLVHGKWSDRLIYGMTSQQLQLKAL